MKVWIAIAASLTLLTTVPMPARAALQLEGSDARSQAAAEKRCPVTPEEEIDLEIFTDDKGERVYFCCERCKRKFEREPERYAVALVQREDHADHGQDADESEVGHSPVSGSTHDATMDEHGDDYDHSHEESKGIVGWLGRFHPAATDFPIALLVAGAFAEFVYMIRRVPLFDAATRFCIWGAALTGLVTAALGWCFGGFRFVDSEELLFLHRWLGTGTALAMVVVLVLSERAHRTPGAKRGLYRAALFGSAALLLGTAFLGGAMVWGLDHYKLPF